METQQVTQTPTPNPIPPPRHSQEEQVPSLNFGGVSIDPRRLLHPGSRLYETLGWVVLVASMVVFTAISYGVFLIVLLISPLVEFFRWRQVRARIRGSGVQIGPDQMPEIHQCVNSFAERLGMKSAPEVYVVEDSVANGLAVKLGTKDIILLTDDVVWGSLQSSDPRSLGFVLGHEMAHIALGHTKLMRSMMRNFFKRAARAQEHTADNVATALVGDPMIAVHGLAVLTVGPQLLPYINDSALLRQAREVWRDRHAKKGERSLTHPLLLRRIASILER